MIAWFFSFLISIAITFVAAFSVVNYLRPILTADHAFLLYSGVLFLMIVCASLVCYFAGIRVGRRKEREENLLLPE